GTGFKLVYPDGSQDVFSLSFYQLGLSDITNLANSTAHAFLTQKIDPQGRVTRIGYEQGSSLDLNSHTNWTAMRVKYVVDPDTRTNTFVYDDTGLQLPVWRLKEI